MPKAASLSTDYRLAILWLIIGAVICVKTGRPVDTTHSYRILLLPSPKAVWEAPAQLSGTTSMKQAVLLEYADYRRLESFSTHKS